jgi:hypothetical protein
MKLRPQLMFVTQRFSFMAGDTEASIERPYFLGLLQIVE